MRFGICSNLKNIELAQKCGYDYLESVLRSLDTLSDEQFREYKHLTNSLHFFVESYNCFYDKQKLVGEDVTPKSELIDYTHRVFERAKLLGGKVVVYGSSWARSIPEGFSYETAKAQFLECLATTGDIASQYDILVVLEPLRLQETNFINYVSEGQKMVEDLNHPNVKLLADLFHVAAMNEDFEDLVIAGDLLQHIHLAEPTQRVIPTVNDAYDYSPFVNALKQIGYQNRISIECGVDNTKLEEQFRAGLALQRKLFLN